MLTNFLDGFRGVWLQLTKLFLSGLNCSQLRWGAADVGNTAAVFNPIGLNIDQTKGWEAMQRSLDRDLEAWLERGE